MARGYSDPPNSREVLSQLTDKPLSGDLKRAIKAIPMFTQADLDAACAKARDEEREAIIAEITGKTIGSGPVRMVVSPNARTGKTYQAAIDAVVDAIRARKVQG